MGCGGSKTTMVKSQTSLTSSSNSGVHRGCGGINADIIIGDNQEINVFENTANNNNELGGSCYNAKPRLRSAIRRNHDIRPVTTDLNETQTQVESEVEAEVETLDRHSSHHHNSKPPPLDLTLTEQGFGSELLLPVNRDSGFDSNRAISEASDERARSVSGGRDESGSISTSTMRPDSNLTGSVITARDLNASFMTMSDDYMTSQPNGDVSLDLDTPLEDFHDFEEPQHYRNYSNNTPSRTHSNTPSRTLSNTPSARATSNTPSARPHSSTPSRMVISTEPLPIPLYPKNIDVIKEESEGGFTPRSIFSPEQAVTPRIKLEPPKEELLKYHSDEVLRHNQKVGWCEWGMYRGKVYDTDKVIKAFSHIYDREEERKKEELFQDKNNINADSDSDEDEEDYFQNSVIPFENLYPKNVINPTRSLGNAIKILVKAGISKDVIHQSLSQCLIGDVVKSELSSQFWESFRKDVNNVLEDLNREDLKDELSENTKDVLEQLQRWILKYQNQNPSPPQPPQPSYDPNVAEFNLPDGVREDCLRHWIEQWEKFDLEIPETGPWFMYKVEDTDLGDAQEIFEASLRTHVDLVNPFETTVDGEAAWSVLHPGIFKDDVMTDDQIRTEESRRNRTDLDDPKRMERRRARLLDYFVNKYEMDTNKVGHFLRWSHAMEEGHVRFQMLCI